MTQGSADEGAIDCHLGDTAGEVMSVLVAVLCDPRGQELLQRAERARRDHLSAQRILLELLQVPLCMINVSDALVSLWSARLLMELSLIHI